MSFNTHDIMVKLEQNDHYDKLLLIKQEEWEQSLMHRNDRNMVYNNVKILILALEHTAHLDFCPDLWEKLSSPFSLVSWFFSLE